jgi:predicted MFS family arabinose efflux permease
VADGATPYRWAVLCAGATGLAVQNTAIFGGSMLAAPLGAALAQYAGWPAAFAALALPAAAAALILTPMVRTTAVPVRTAHFRQADGRLAR